MEVKNMRELKTKKKTRWKSAGFYLVFAERARFELANRFCRSHAFQTGNLRVILY